MKFEDDEGHLVAVVMAICFACVLLFGIIPSCTRMALDHTPVHTPEAK